MNYMEQFAEMLGVKMKEDFKIDGSIFHCTNEGIHVKDGYDWYPVTREIYEDLLTGKAKIVKLPWKPKKGEGYWYFNYKGDTIEVEWNDDFNDKINYAIGNCYRTEKEALADKENLLERIKKIAEANGR